PTLLTATLAPNIILLRSRVKHSVPQAGCSGNGGIGMVAARYCRAWSRHLLALRIQERPAHRRPARGQKNVERLVLALTASLWQDAAVPGRRATEAPMERTKLEEFVASAALLAAHLTRQCEESISGQRNAAEDLRRNVDSIGQRVLGANAELQQHARSAIREALTEEISVAARSLRETAMQLEETAARLQREQVSISLRIRVL